MAGMERFTQRARRVLSLAHQEAEQSRNNNIGTENLQPKPSRYWNMQSMKHADLVTITSARNTSCWALSV
jgi:hypothetical protein